MSLDGKRICAIILAARIGKRIQNDFPDIGLEYRLDESSYSNLITKYGLINFYDTHGMQIAKAALSYAIKGYNGSRDLPGYEGLIPDRDELEGIHLKKMSRSGIYCRDHKVGAYGLSPDDKRIAGINGAREQGKVEWTDSEEKRLVELYDFLSHKKGYLESIADILNKEKHKGKKIRNGGSVNQRICRLHLREISRVGYSQVS